MNSLNNQSYTVSLQWTLQRYMKEPFWRYIWKRPVRTNGYTFCRL